MNARHMRVSTPGGLLAVCCAHTARSTAPALFFQNLFSYSQLPNPADDYSPDLSAPPATLPRSYDELHAAAIEGVLSAVSRMSAGCCEVDFPPIANVNARGDGSAKSERLVADANADFVKKLCSALASRAKATPAIVGCGGSSLRALGDGAIRLREAANLPESCNVAIVVSPADEEQWEAAEALSANRAIIIVNGLLNNGRHGHAYFYKPLTAFSKQTGGCVRCFPGPYEIYDVTGRRLDDVEVSLTRQGRRALPDTKDAQMLLQNRFGQL